MEVINCKSRIGKKNMQKEHVIMGIPISSHGYAFSAKPLLLPDPASQYQLLPSPANHYYKIRHSRVDSVIAKINKLGQSVDILAQGIREHGNDSKLMFKQLLIFESEENKHDQHFMTFAVRLGPKLSETVKGKLSLGARILQLGGVDKVFKQKFDIRDGEKLLKASQCYLSTTGGPIAGLLFISNHRVAFCSERLIKLSSPSGKLVKIHYKVMIPLRKIKRANESENVKRPTQKYVQLVTEDNFDFWFMGFLNHQRTFKYLQQAIHQAR